MRQSPIFSAADRVKLRQVVGDWNIVERIRDAVRRHVERDGRSPEPPAARMRKDIGRVREAAAALLAALETMHEECEYYVEAGPDSTLHTMVYDLHLRAEHFLSRRFKRGPHRARDRHDLEDRIAVLLDRCGTPGAKLESALRIVVKATEGRAPADLRPCVKHARKAIRDSRREAEVLAP